MARKRELSQAGRELAKMRWKGMTPMQISEVNSKNAKLYWDRMTPEERREQIKRRFGKKGAKKAKRAAV